jgi:hypothetical protein
MTVTTDLVNFSSLSNIDKIQSWSTTTDSSTGLSSGYSFTIPANPTPASLISGTGSIANPYGHKGLPHLIWSIDNTNWYAMGSQILYYNGGLAQYVTKVAVSMSVSASTLWFIATTGYTSSQLIYIQFAVDNPT